MMRKDDRTLTIAECIELWENEGALNAKIAQLENKCARLRDNVDSLRQAEKNLCVSVANLCYNMGQILEITSILADTSDK